ncbi:MAG: energy-coupled thiamine transporter ThiT [Firmicutes bacterium]|nr:energy-coupled thiamine transporter ThiT [Bacillota bacterium]
MRRERTALIVEIAMAVALAAVLGLVRVFRMPQGGSVSLEMLPILYLGLRRGSAVGMVTGAVYGFVQLVTDPYVAHPIQFMLDYPVAYTLVGLAGLVPSRPVLGVAMGTLGRLAIHTCSGAIFFAAYAWEGWHAWTYSLVYNLSYLVPEAIICAIAVSLILHSRQTA